MWGNPDLWLGWCLPDAERAWRLFLPLVAPDGTPQPWPVAAGDLEAQLWWPTLAEYSGIGGPALDLEPASGLIEADTLAALSAALDAVAGPDAAWRHLQECRGRAGRRVAAPAGRARPALQRRPREAHGPGT